MKSDGLKTDKYPVLAPASLSSSDSIGPIFIAALFFSTLAWLVLSTKLGLEPKLQWMLVGGLLMYNLARNDTTFPRSDLELKAKGLDIKDRRLNAIMPWDWVTKVEIRQRTLSIFPNYVYFKFKDKSDVLILWEDVCDKMDSTTLISCVRTWAPHAEIKGDAKLTKSESIATYTELWLSGMNSSKSTKRLRQDHAIPEETILNNSYKIERLLSGGGQGTAYLASVLPHAEVPNMPPQVVIKELILPSTDRGLKKATDGLIKEVAILRRISSDKIVSLYDFFIEDMRGYLVIEYIDGETLRQLVARCGPLQESRVAEIGVSLCDALSYLHGLTPSIIHGDVTPDNIMIDKSGAVKLMDFDASQELTRNKTNTVVGKHAYMSPEQFKGILNESSDTYALACTLHFLLTGVDPEPISESRPADLVKTVGVEMNRIVSAATKFNFEERLLDLKQLRSQLERI